MKPLTERMLQIGITVITLWVLWMFAKDTVIQIIKLSNQAQVAEMKLRQCEERQHGTQN